MTKSVLNVAAILAILLVVGAGCTTNQGNTAATATPAGNTGAQGLKIAYVNIDTLEKHYELLKSKREEFRRRQEVMEGELQASYQKMQTRGMDMQRKAQTMTQTELQAAEKELMAMQQSLESRKEDLTEKLMKEQEELNRNLKRTLDSFLEAYNKDKHYDFILSYSAAGGSVIMYANRQYEITADVIAGMNAATSPNTKK